MPYQNKLLGHILLKKKKKPLKKSHVYRIFLMLKMAKVLEIVFLYLAQEKVGNKKGLKCYESPTGKRKTGKEK